VEKSFLTIAGDVKDRLIIDGISKEPRGQTLTPVPINKKGCC
jgi:hypothetical protein